MKLLSELTKEEFVDEMLKAGMTPVDGVPRVNWSGDNDRCIDGVSPVDGVAKGWGFRRSGCYWMGRHVAGESWTVFNSVREVKEHIDGLPDAVPSSVITAGGGSGETINAVRRHYEKATAAYGDLTDGVPYERWTGPEPVPAPATRRQFSIVEAYGAMASLAALLAELEGEVQDRVDTNGCWSELECHGCRAE
jgi:hypothetical protein